MLQWFESKKGVFGIRAYARSQHEITGTPTHITMVSERKST